MIDNGGREFAMTATVLSGTEIAGEIGREVKESVEVLAREHKVVPGLAVIIVGENPASQVYVNRKHKACLEFGIRSQIIRLPASTPESELLAQIRLLNEQPEINGILVQLPLPGHINAERVLESIRPDKDVDGFHPLNAGYLSIGREVLVPCTPYGIVKMLEISGIPVEGRRAVIIGRSNIVGKPLAALLLARNATVTVCHSRTRDLPSITREADILVAAVGRPRYVTREMVKPGAAVIDVGINRVGDRLVGDVDFDAVKEVAAYITPVPGGVGPLTIVMLLFNTLKAARLQLGIC